MRVPLSPRLLACCRYIAPGDRVADVGTDHGYLSIYLLQKGLASRVYATDLREKPLQKARENSRRFGVAEKMTFFCTPGLRGVPRDFDTLVCAGMGADTICEILGEAPWLRTGAYRLVLQCQSSGNDLRRFLAENGWTICREQLVRDGKFLYTVIEAKAGAPGPLTPGEEYVSPALFREGGDLLPEYLARCAAGARAAAEGICRSRDPMDLERLPYYERAYEEIKRMEETLCQR